jgi:hypothetical protein
MSYPCFSVRCNGGLNEGSLYEIEIGIGIPYEAFVKSSNFSFDPLFDKKAAEMKILDAVCIRSEQNSEPWSHCIVAPPSRKDLEDEKMVLVLIKDCTGERLIFMSEERTEDLSGNWPIALVLSCKGGKIRLAVKGRKKLI